MVSHKVICPHCNKKLNEIIEVVTKIDILNWMPAGYMSSFCKGPGYTWKHEPNKKDFWEEDDDAYNRSGFEPNYTSAIRLCPYCQYIIPLDMVEKEMCQMTQQEDIPALEQGLRQQAQEERLQQLEKLVKD
jgi:hypothetical protein